MSKSSSALIVQALNLFILLGTVASAPASMPTAHQDSTPLEGCYCVLDRACCWPPPENASANAVSIENGHCHKSNGGKCSDLKMKIKNDMNTSITTAYTTLTSGLVQITCDDSPETQMSYNTLKNPDFQATCLMTIPPGQSRTITAEECGSGCYSKSKHGAEGVLTFTVEAAYTKRTSLDYVTLYWNHNGDTDGHGTYSVSFSNGVYEPSREKTYEDDQCSTCNYGAQVSQYYCKQRNECSGEVRCGTDALLDYNACPKQPSWTAYTWQNTTNCIPPPESMYAPNELNSDYGPCYGQSQTPEITLTEALPYSSVTFGNYQGIWKPMGQFLSSATLTEATSWESSQSSSVGTSFSSGMSLEAEFGFFGANMASSVTTEVSHEASTSLETSQGGSTEVSYQSLDCSNGNLWVWAISADASDGSGSQHVYTSNFACLPSWVSATTGPKCPSRYCHSAPCQCCNAVWDTDQDPIKSHLAKANGGNCTETEPK